MIEKDPSVIIYFFNIHPRRPPTLCFCFQSGGGAKTTDSISNLQKPPFFKTIKIKIPICITFHPNLNAQIKFIQFLVRYLSLFPFLQSLIVCFFFLRNPSTDMEKLSWIRNIYCFSVIYIWGSLVLSPVFWFCFACSFTFQWLNVWD